MTLAMPPAHEHVTPAPAWRVTPTADSHFAWLRTKLAVDRTFMAWLRTSIAMIGFGFTLVQFFASFAKLERVAPAVAPRAPVILGLMLVGTGTVALAIALIQYIETLRHLDSPQFGPIAEHRKHLDPALWLGGAVLVIGIVAFVAIIVRAVLEA
jgi:putative membrane protein